MSVEAAAHLAALGIPILNFTLLLVLIFASRKWTGPGQADLIRQMRDEVDIVRRTAEGLDNSMRQWRDDYLQGEKRMWDQMRVLSTGLLTEPNMKRLEARIDEIETVIRGVPCMVRAQEGCDEGEER